MLKLLIYRIWNKLMKGNENEINKLEHDGSFHVKRVATYKEDGLGNLVREAVAGMNIGLYDYIELGYTGSNVTSITYKNGGSGGTTLATLTLAYDGSNNLTSVTKS